MPNFSFVQLFSILILLAPVIDELPQRSTDPFGLSTALDELENQSRTEDGLLLPNSQQAAQSSARAGIANQDVRGPSQIEEQESVPLPGSDWPAMEAAQVTGLPSLLPRTTQASASTATDESRTDATRGETKAATKSDTNSDTKSGTKAKLASQPKGEHSKRAERTSVPFSEVITKLQPKNAKSLAPEMEIRRRKIEECLKYHYIKPVNADALRPWSIMHGVLAYGQDSLVASRGKRFNAVEYLCQNGIGNDRRLLQLDRDQISVATGIGVQGHEGQLLAVLAQVETPVDQPLTVNGRSFTVRDLVEHEKATCRPATELTFKLIGLSVYLESDAVWKDNTGQAWDISRLMYEEMAQPIKGAACGGIHRLMGLSYALTMRKANQEPIDGQWQRAEKFIASYHQQALALQTADGGFSTEFFEGMSTSADPIRQIYSTGHLLEWLAISMTEEQLSSPAVTRMVDRLLALLASEFKPDEELHGTDVGPKGHALRALRLYELRLFGKPSHYTEFRDQDPRPILSADQVVTLQQHQRTIMPASAGESNYQQSSHSRSGSGNSSSSMPTVRGNRMLRRR